MNASGYLKGQGWRGEGHSLDTTNRGLSRPLLVTHKVDLAGLGTKKNDFGNQWWMDSFDKSLKGVMKIQIAKPVDLPRLKGFKYGNLYTNFVHAETLESTIKKDDFLYGKAFSDTKPMAEDPQKVAQRRLSQSTVAPGVILGLDTTNDGIVRTKKRKAEVEDDGETSSKKAKKAKKERKEKKEKKEKKAKKEKTEKKTRKNKQVEDDDLSTSEPEKKSETPKSGLVSDDDTRDAQDTNTVAPDSSKNKKRKKDKDVSETDSSKAVQDKRKKKAKNSKDEAVSGEGSVDSTEASESGARKHKNKSKKSKKEITEGR